MPFPKRFSDWPARLRAEIECAQSKSFAFGSFDCALFACDVIRALTGVDPGASFRGKYDSKETAAAAIAAYAGDGADIGALAAKITADHSAPEIPVRFAGRGDVVLIINQENEPSLGIVGLDARFVVCASEKGLARVAMKHWLRAWRVG